MSYQACDFYVTRIPLLPIEDYVHVFDSKDINETRNALIKCFQNPIFEETLAVASQESYQALCRLENSNQSRSVEQLLSTLLKYYIRLTTRPTSYGLFSGVSLGRFGDTGTIESYGSHGIGILNLYTGRNAIEGRENTTKTIALCDNLEV